MFTVWRYLIGKIVIECIYVFTSLTTTISQCGIAVVRIVGEDSQKCFDYKSYQ